MLSAKQPKQQPVPKPGNELPPYPPDHQVGMRVPKGGSSCSKCEYVDGQNCKERHFIFWNGSNVIPAPVNDYCCDFFNTKD